MTTPNILIAGAGIIGLSTALELATHGLRVTVLERDEPMREASWAAAGMLAAHDPENPPALRPLADHSLALYPDFLAYIEQLSGLSVPIRTHTTLQAVPAGTPGTLSPEDLQTLIAGIAPGNYLQLEEQSLDPRDLCAALPRACIAAGVSVLTSTAVIAHESTGSAVEAQTNNERLTAGDFLDCRGAWAVSNAAPAPRAITPRKGQMLAVVLPSGLRLSYVLRTPELYLVPRGAPGALPRGADSDTTRVIIGATVEQAGYDKQIHPAAINHLYAQACALFPPLAAARITDTWAGLRPATADGLPILDTTGPHSFLAAGHYRNGILLAPGTARLMRQLLLGQPPDLDLHPFRAERFAIAHDKQLTATL